MSNCARPKPMSHLDFRVKLAKTLRLRADGVEADDSVCVTPSRRRRSQLGLPTSEEMANRRPSKKPRVRRYHVGPGKLDEVMKEPAVLSLPKRKFVPAKGEKYDLFSEQSMTRFEDGDMIPGVHRLVSIKGGRSRCQVCCAMGSRGSYGPKKNCKEPPRAKLRCQNKFCGGISLCSVECSNIWHIKSDAS